MDSQVTRSRQRILECAVVLLREGNLPGQLVKAAAAAARVPLANAKQFFQNDEELILAFYLRLANDLEVRASTLPLEGVAERFRVLMLAKLGLVGPYREAFAGLFAKMLDPRTNIGVFSKQTELVRLRARAAFAKVVHGANDAPSEATQLIQGLYAAHSALLLIWLTNAVRRLSREVAAAPPEIGIARVKAAAKNVPAWVTVVAWTSLAAVTVLFLYSSKLF
jgi:hypothetical protein